MQKVDLGQTITILANVGVIAGILLLAYELRQNNVLMEAEARYNRLVVVTDAWRFTAEQADLTELRTRADSGEVLSVAEQRRVESSVMAVLVLLEWTYRELGKGSTELSQVREVQRHNFANYLSYNQVWEARKQSFDPQFVEWFEEHVVRFANR